MWSLEFHTKPFKTLLGVTCNFTVTALSVRDIPWASLAAPRRTSLGNVCLYLLTLFLLFSYLFAPNLEKYTRFPPQWAVETKCKSMEREKKPFIYSAAL